MRRSTYYLFLLPVALAFMALVPMYPAQATDYATFGNPQTTYIPGSKQLSYAQQDIFQQIAKFRLRP